MLIYGLESIGNHLMSLAIKAQTALTSLHCMEYVHASCTIAVTLELRLHKHSLHHII